MAKTDSPYTFAFTACPFLFQEFIAMLPILLQGKISIADNEK